MPTCRGSRANPLSAAPPRVGAALAVHRGSPDVKGELSTYLKGEVIAVGPGKRSENGDSQPVDVKVGDTVVFGKYSSNTVKIGEEELLILNESEIFGVIES